MTIPEGFQLDSGFRDDVTFTIVSAYFAPTANYQDGKVTMLQLIGFDEDDDPFTIKMACGADWTSSDGGESITHPTKKRINKNSIYGHWIQACYEIPELIQLLASRAESPLVASIWTDLVLHCQLREISFGRNIDPISRLMPTEFIGTSESAPTNAVNLTPPANASNMPTVPVATAQSSEAVPPPTAAERIAAARAAKSSPTPVSPIMARLIDLAKSSPSHDAFMTAAFEIDEVLADDDLATQVATENGIYKTANS